MAAAPKRVPLQESGISVSTEVAVFVEPDPLRPGAERARLVNHGIAAWAILGHLDALHPTFSTESEEQAAEDVRVTPGAIETANSYYRQHQEAIDARFAANAAAVA